MTSDSSQNSEYADIVKRRRPRKRLRRAKSESVIEEDDFEFPLQHLLSVLRKTCSNDDDSFEHLIDPLLEDFLQARLSQESVSQETDDQGRVTRPLHRAEVTSLVRALDSKDALSTLQAILRRKLKVERQRNQAALEAPNISVADTSIEPIPPAITRVPPHPEVLDALYTIKTTPYSNSFLSRIHGTREYLPAGLLAVDWETRTPWMDLMDDIHAHHTLAQESSVLEVAPITYSTLQASQVSQINDLLERSFWAGIDISDSLEYTPERSTVVAMYKKVVVGVAIIPSPIETYITYLAVKAGWDKAQIARNMLYHLITLNPTRDFTLHVSTNNSAILLYNQFGFKAEEFVAGFYSDYLHPNSRASKNAFKLRLRRV